MVLTAATVHEVGLRKLAARPGELNFAFVSDWLAVSGGAECAFGEMTRLYPGPVYASQGNPELFDWMVGHDFRTSFVQKLPLALTKHYIYAPIMPLIYRGFDFSEFECLVVASHSFAHHCRVRPGTAYVCYYHTPARSLWNPEIDDRASAGRLGWIRRLISPIYKKLDYQASKGPTYLIANSKTTAARVYQHYGREVDSVVYPPVFTQQWLDVPRKSHREGFVMWGRQVKYKRTDLAIEAVKITGDRLHIVGQGPEISSLKRRAEGMPNVTFHGRLPMPELKRLLSESRGVLFPGYEDFGIVPVESMAAGLPVVAYAAGGATETVGEDGGILFKNQTAQDLANAIQELNQREFDPERLRAKARPFDVSHFDRNFRRCVEQAIGREKNRAANQSPSR